MAKRDPQQLHSPCGVVEEGKDHRQGHHQPADRAEDAAGHEDLEQNEHESRDKQAENGAGVVHGLWDSAICWAIRGRPRPPFLQCRDRTAFCNPAARFSVPHPNGGGASGAGRKRAHGPGRGHTDTHGRKPTDTDSPPGRRGGPSRPFPSVSVPVLTEPTGSAGSSPCGPGPSPERLQRGGRSECASMERSPKNVANPLCGPKAARLSHALLARQGGDHSVAGIR